METATPTSTCYAYLSIDKLNRPFLHFKYRV